MHITTSIKLVNLHLCTPTIQWGTGSFSGNRTLWVRKEAFQSLESVHSSKHEPERSLCAPVNRAVSGLSQGTSTDLSRALWNHLFNHLRRPESSSSSPQQMSSADSHKGEHKRYASQPWREMIKDIDLGNLWPYEEYLLKHHSFLPVLDVPKSLSLKQRSACPPLFF